MKKDSVLIPKASIDDLKKERWTIHSTIGATEIAALHGIHWLGSYNNPPENFKEITEEEFAQGGFTTYSPVISAFRQLYFKGQLISITLQVDPFGTGWGFYPDYYAKEVRWFKFNACNHKWKVMKASHCYREYVCEKCGMENAVDSSD